MTLLALHRCVFTWHRIFPFADGTDRKTLRRSLAFSVFVILIEVLSFASSVLYFYKNVLNNKKYTGNSLYPIAQIAGYGSTLYTLIVAYIIRDKVRNMFDRVQEIYDGLYFSTELSCFVGIEKFTFNQNRRRK